MSHYWYGPYPWIEESYESITNSNVKEIIVAGSEDDDVGVVPEHIRRARQQETLARRERIGRAYFTQGLMPVIQTAQLKGPLDNWKNPWLKDKAQRTANSTSSFPTLKRPTGPAPNVAGIQPDPAERLPTNEFRNHEERPPTTLGEAYGQPKSSAEVEQWMSKVNTVEVATSAGSITPNPDELYDADEDMSDCDDSVHSFQEISHLASGSFVVEEEESKAMPQALTSKKRLADNSWLQSRLSSKRSRNHDATPSSPTPQPTKKGGHDFGDGLMPDAASIAAMSRRQSPSISIGMAQLSPSRVKIPEEDGDTYGSLEYYDTDTRVPAIMKLGTSGTVDEVPTSDDVTNRNIIVDDTRRSQRQARQYTISPIPGRSENCAESYKHGRPAEQTVEQDDGTSCIYPRNNLDRVRRAITFSEGESPGFTHAARRRHAQRLSRSDQPDSSKSPGVVVDQGDLFKSTIDSNRADTSNLSESILQDVALHEIISTKDAVSSGENDQMKEAKALDMLKSYKNPSYETLSDDTTIRSRSIPPKQAQNELDVQNEIDTRNTADAPCEISLQSGVEADNKVEAQGEVDAGSMNQAISYHDEETSISVGQDVTSSQKDTVQSPWICAVNNKVDLFQAADTTLIVNRQLGILSFTEDIASPAGVSSGINGTGIANTEQARVDEKMYPAELPALESTLSENVETVASNDEPPLHAEHPKSSDSYASLSSLMTPSPEKASTETLAFLPSTQTLVQAAINNPWSSSLRRPGAGKPAHRVSFGPLPSVNVENVKGLKVSPPPLSPESSENSFRDEVNTRKSSPEVSRSGSHESTTTALSQRSPGVNAMAEAFIAAEAQGELLDDSCTLGPSTIIADPVRVAEDVVVVDENESGPNNTPEAQLMREIEAEREWEAESSSFRISTCGMVTPVKVVQGPLDVDADLNDAIEEMGSFLEGWDVDVEMQKIQRARDSQDSVNSQNDALRSRILV